MLRQRNLKIEFWGDPKINRVSLSARLTYLGIVQYVEDNGVNIASLEQVTYSLYATDFYHNPQEVKQRVIDDIKQLIEQELIRFYKVEDTYYIYVVDFNEQQYIARKSKGHAYPQPVEPVDIECSLEQYEQLCTMLGV